MYEACSEILQRIFVYHQILGKSKLSIIFAPVSRKALRMSFEAVSEYDERKFRNTKSFMRKFPTHQVKYLKKKTKQDFEFNIFI